MDTMFDNLAHDLRQSWKVKSYTDARSKLIEAAQQHITRINIHCAGHVFTDDDIDHLLNQGIDVTETDEGGGLND